MQVTLVGALSASSITRMFPVFTAYTGMSITQSQSPLTNQSIAAACRLNRVSTDRGAAQGAEFD